MTITAKGRTTRQRIIEGAAVHLRSEEPGTVTLDDIRAITGTSKGQIFHYFPGGKAELLVAVARYEAGRVLEDQQPHLGALTSWAAWDRWREAVLARYRAQGPHCPLGSLMAQVGTTAGTAEVVATLLSQWREHIRRGIAAMRDAGLVRDQVDPDAVAMTFVAAIQGGVQVLRTTGSVEYLETSMNTLVAQLRNG